MFLDTVPIQTAIRMEEDLASHGSMDKLEASWCYTTLTIFFLRTCLPVDIAKQSKSTVQHYVASFRMLD
jgi:hypothetical protein